MGCDSIEYLIMLEKEFSIRIPDCDVSTFLTVGDTEQYLRKRCPELDPSEIARRHRGVLGEMLTLEPSQAKRIQPSDRFVEDLNFE